MQVGSPSPSVSPPPFPSMPSVCWDPTVPSSTASPGQPSCQQEMAMELHQTAGWVLWAVAVLLFLVAMGVTVVLFG